MVPSKKIICLANSKKLGNRCVAGIDSEGNWIRFVNAGGDALDRRDISNELGKQPRVLETWDVMVKSQEPLYFQPENWVIDARYYWERSNDEIYPDLDDFCQDTDYIFVNTSDRLLATYLEQNPIKSSLMLIFVDSITFQKTWSNNHIQVRAKFWYNNNLYNLAVTDTEWENLFKDRTGDYWDFGDYFFDGGYYLTVGLGTEYQGYHYKLVVAVIPLDKVEEAQVSYLF
jgi:hypothetical protein